MPRAHPNPLVAAFTPLLEFAPELENAASPAQPEALRTRLQDTLIDARDASVGMGMPLTRANQAAWFVAALLDDIALNTPWGGHSDWPRQPLVVGLSGDVDAGTRFFDQLDELTRHANRDPEMLELAYLCLGLGFRGKYRVPGRGRRRRTDGAAHPDRPAIAQCRCAGRPLSPHWQGVAAPDERRRFVVPLWTVALAAIAIIAAIYIGLALQLSRKVRAALHAGRRLPPPERADIFRPLRANVDRSPAIAVDPVEFELLPHLRQGPARTAAGAEGREDVSLAILVVQGTNPELFRSAKAELNAGYAPLIASIAECVRECRSDRQDHCRRAYRQCSGAAQQSLRPTRAFPRPARRPLPTLIAAGHTSRNRKSEGRADSDPIGDNATKEGRAQNRRIEIKIEKRL